MNQLHKEYFVPAFLGILGVAAALLFIFSIPASASANGVFGSGAHAASTTLEVMINDSGHASVRGAKVTGISGTTITAQTLLGSTVLSWTVATDANTKFIPRSGTTTPSIANVKVGDYIAFSGTIDTALSGLTVHAKVVHDASFVPATTTEKHDQNDESGKGDSEGNQKKGSFFESFKSHFHFFFR